MKYCQQLTDEMAQWVAENGLIEYGGAMLKTFCEEFKIDEQTYYDWLEKSDFSDAIKTAKQKFREKSARNIALSLSKKAVGYIVPEERTEEIRNANGILVSTKKITTNKHYSPDTGAAIFLLTNLRPDEWQNKYNAEHTVNSNFDYIGALTEAQQEDNTKTDNADKGKSDIRQATDEQ